MLIRLETHSLVGVRSSQIAPYCKHGLVLKVSSRIQKKVFSLDIFAKSVSVLECVGGSHKGTNKIAPRCAASANGAFL